MSDNDFGDISKIINFQLERRILSLTKNFLVLLEKDKAYISRLEKLLEDAGFEDKTFKQGADLFKDARKSSLDIGNETVRELQNLIEKFDIKIKI